MKPAMFFSPNLTGPLHVANAIVMWLTYKEAVKRDCRFIVCFDDLPCPIDSPGQARPVPTIKDRMATAQSVFEACEFLGIEDLEFHYRSSYVARYYEVAEIMQDMGLLVPVTATIYTHVNSRITKDAICGTIGDQNDMVRACHCFGRPFVTLVDFFDFKTPLHIRGYDISITVAPELRLWPLMCKVLGYRPPMEYAHIPQIARADGSILHKSTLENPNVRVGIDEDNPYLFTIWAQRWQDAKERREALESIVLMPGKPYALSNIYPQPKTLLMYDAETHTVEQKVEKSARRRELERTGQWPG